MRKAAMNAIYRLAQRDERVVFIGSDLGAGALAEMRREFPERWFMEGVCEQSIVGMAAGLAMEGYLPYINTIATFLTRRCYEQIAIDVCLHRLPVRLIASGGGAVYAPLGPTHMALDDVAILRALPGMTIVAPADAPEMDRVMDATLAHPGPVYVRVAKGGDPIISRPENGFEFGRAIRMRPGNEVVFLATGVLTSRALRAAEILSEQGIDAGVVHVHTLKPLDVETVAGAGRSSRLLVTIEEHSRAGGLGSAVAETLADAGIGTALLRLGLPDRFSRDYGSQDHVLAEAGLDAGGIVASVTARMRAPSLV